MVAIIGSNPIVSTRYLILPIFIGKAEMYMIRLMSLIESPDSIKIDGKYYYVNQRTRPFVYSSKLNKIFIGEKGETHEAMRSMFSIYQDFDSDPWRESGRIFFEPKIISFWQKLPAARIKVILKALAAELKIDFVGYRIEIYKHGIVAIK